MISEKKNIRLCITNAVLLLLLLSASCKENKCAVRQLSIKKQDGTVITLRAEMAVTEEQRQHGFMNRKHIPDGTGMLFVFDSDQILRFWMKNTPTPLSIAYITGGGKIRDIFDMTPYSLADVTSSGYVKYALEVPQGWYEKNGISDEDSLVLDF